MFIHPPGVDSLSSLSSLFLTSEPLCGRSPAESEEKYLSDKPVSLRANILIYYLPIILSFNISLLLRSPQANVWEVAYDVTCGKDAEALN